MTARIPYNRTYWVIDAQLPAARRAELYTQAGQAQVTAGPSFDDAGNGDGLLSRTAVIWDRPQATHAELLSWFALHYPGTHVVFDGNSSNPPDPEQDPQPGGRSLKMGLHASASSHITAYGQYHILQPAFIKVLSNHNKDGIAALAAQHNATFIVRAYLDFWENGNPRKVPALKFHDWTKDDLAQVFEILNGHGRPFVVEVHNEPNLVQEGHMRDADNHPSDPGSWCSGVQFNTWLTTYQMHFRNTFGAAVQLITPGLSPGGHVLDVRADSAQFFTSMAQAINVYGAMGVHVYWSEQAPVTTALAQLNAIRAQFPNVLKYITEFSHNKAATAERKAYTMAQFIRAIEPMQDVVGATAFVAADPFFNYPYEAWDKMGMATHFRAAMGY